MIGYSTGEISTSLMMNSVFAFAMLFYTEALGLPPALAGVAMAVATFWDGITDPVMGQISDKTRSRFGRRHGWLVGGGILMAAGYLLLWVVPEPFQDDNLSLFAYLLVVNLVFRTAFTVFFVPYMALGFEICTDYDGRSRIQSIRYVFNMAANFLGPAMSWALFFGDEGGRRGTTNPGNYTAMALVFAAVAVGFVLFVAFVTRGSIEDTRGNPKQPMAVRALVRETGGILRDGASAWVFGFVILVILGISTVSTLQTYVYDIYMDFPAALKSVTHGGTMLGMALGALTGPFLVRRFDKVRSCVIGGIVNAGCNLTLAAIFLPDYGIHWADFALLGLPVDFLLFAPLNGLFWFGFGIMLPVSTSMMADASEANALRTGRNRDGSYSALFTFALKFAQSIGMLGSGLLLTAIGLEAGRQGPPPESVLWNLGATFFLIGPLIAVFGLLLIRKFPLDREALERARGKAGPYQDRP